MRWSFHGLTVEGHTSDAELRERWQRSFASRPASEAGPDLRCTFELVSDVPAPPDGEPRFRQGDVIAYYPDAERVIAHLPRYGQLQLDLAHGHTEGCLVRAALARYGVLEDVLAIALSPHLRRRGLFLIHAFAAATSHQRERRAVLIVGPVGAGKTTTGLALLAAGWKLLANDAPILRAPGDVLAYPGLLAGYPDTFARFPATAHLARPGAAAGEKITLAAEALWPEVWIERAPCAAIVFPQVEPRAGHAVEPLRPPEALRRLLPHAVEQWDKAMMPAHLQLLSQLVQAAPAFRLRLGPEVSALPDLFASLLGG